MTKYFLEYLAFLDAALEDEHTDFGRLMKIHKEKTRYFQHERFVHLFVMILFAICTIMTILAIVVTEKMVLTVLALMLLILLVPYIKHYWFLENNVQKLYKYYDKIAEKLDKEEL